jgi:hypothetical protein
LSRTAAADSRRSNSSTAGACWHALATHLPPSYPEAVGILLRSLGPELATDELIGVGMGPVFYFPHTVFVAERGLEHFDLSMQAQYD